MTIDAEKTKEFSVSERNELDLPQKFQYKKNQVVIVECRNYNSQTIRTALKKIIKLLDMDSYFQRKKILLKPNYLAPSEYAYTEPKIVITLSEILKELGADQILVGDSTMTKGLTSITLKRTCIKEECEENDLELINFFESDRKKIVLENPSSAAEPQIFLPKQAADADIVINMPKLKTHNGYVYTGAIKNLFGLLSNKMKMHMKYKNKTLFQKLLADIYFAVEQTGNEDHPKMLTIMDGVIAMEGNGPRAGEPRSTNVLIAGFNPAAVDSVGFSLMNGNPNQLTAIKSVANRTNLDINMENLEILGVSDHKKYVIRDFKKPSLKVLQERQVSGLFSKIADKMTSISIKINKSNCTLCQQCVNHCPAEAMVRKNNRIVIDQEKCVECFCCGESCPNDAISAKFYLFRVLPYLILALVGFGIGIGFGIWYLVIFLSTL